MSSTAASHTASAAIPARRLRRRLLTVGHGKGSAPSLPGNSFLECFVSPRPSRVPHLPPAMDRGGENGSGELGVYQCTRVVRKLDVLPTIEE
mmetsp:Transcript_10584/g.27762  ORF Transcript_10584/g.27762 Transcript_10584/m.27762 type:complete len:92 (+) Transcript_10584:159-434(+)